MRGSSTLALVETIKDRCRTCYQCVRECPAKAIRIIEGQAEVIPERCIGCGNCVRECNQHAKVAVSAVDDVRALLGARGPVAAILAPSFAAEFGELDWRVLVGMVRALGFQRVHEVGFGADLVALEYRRLLDRPDGRRYIATTCPAIVCYVEKYHPELVPALAPVVSPMVASARLLRRLYGGEMHVVFIGPCLAKRREARSEELEGEVAHTLTFAELRCLFATTGLDAAGVAPSQFDPPHAGVGAIFAVKRGLLQAAAIGEDLVANDVISAGGSTAFAEAIREFGADSPSIRLLEVLCCNGCIMGAGMTGQTTLFSRRARVAQYARQRLGHVNRRVWEEDVERFTGLDLGRGFAPQDQRLPMPTRAELERILGRMGKREPQDELNCGACGYRTCVEHATAVHLGLAESEMCLPYAIEQLHRTVEELNISHRELASAQEALLQSEKLASMGQLAAGIAHEINNPLGVVLMYAHLLLEETPEGEGLHEDLKLITEEADRCKKIVAGLLDFARQNQVVRAPVDVCEMVDKTLRALPPPAGVEVQVLHRVADPVAELDRDQFVQVLTNLVTNAYTAMPQGGRLTVAVDGEPETVAFRVADTGIGIPRENLERIFHPFFTTKQLGKGTGLGLAVTYGIVKMHRGSITCQSSADPAQGPTGTTFAVILPRTGEAAQ
ncbi:MAG: [Fe-Fe] hydrogenase large subunit C-terminal domain-containing protein [Candidatus Latescibacterota bacterium]